MKLVVVVVVLVCASAETTTTTTTTRTTCVSSDSASVDASPAHRVVDAFYIVRPLLCSLCKFTSAMPNISVRLSTSVYSVKFVMPQRFISRSVEAIFKLFEIRFGVNDIVYG